MVGCPSRSGPRFARRTNARGLKHEDRKRSIAGPLGRQGSGANRAMQVLEARDLACLRGERVVFAGLSFAVARRRGTAADRRERHRQIDAAAHAGRAVRVRPRARVLWAGADIAADRAAHAARLRYVSHQDALKPALTVAENLGFFAGLWGGAVAAGAGGAGAGGARRPAGPGALRRARSGGWRWRGWRWRRPRCGCWTSRPRGSMRPRSSGWGRCWRCIGRPAGIVVAATHIPLPLPDARELRL